ncbi:SdpI family protein [Candidatus Woesearchaeota archaeon]|nr:SdpI family protein [Candidatus Woesearchaeota archaeon]
MHRKDESGCGILIRKSIIIVLTIVFLSFATAIYFYPQMPEQMASHWNSQGVVDGYMSKFWGLFLMPIISIGLLLLFILIPILDPMTANIEKFRKYFDGFMILFFLFLFYIYILIILINLGKEMNIVFYLVPAFGILFFSIGVMIENSKRNWSIGIRTPWTISSENVWNKTHKLGGTLFKLAGLFSILGLLFQKIAFLLMIVPVVVFSLFLIIYSYILYKKEKASI